MRIFRTLAGIAVVLALAGMAAWPADEVPAIGSSVPSPPETGDASPSAPETTVERSTERSSPTTTTTSGSRDGAEIEPPVSMAARSSAPIAVYAHPRATRPVRTLPETTILGTPTVVSVIDTRDGWTLARLPGRPNGATGWIRSADLEMFGFDREVVVDLSERLLTVYTDGVANFQTDVAVGSAASPTPTGTFFVTDAVALTRPNGPWGPFAFGLSARSDVVTEFAGGDGIIGIHGTNQPWSIGDAASLGCVRLPNDVMTTLWEIVAVGMKVTIQA